MILSSSIAASRKVINLYHNHIYSVFSRLDNLSSPHAHAPIDGDGARKRDDINARAYVSRVSLVECAPKLREPSCRNYTSGGER